MLVFSRSSALSSLACRLHGSHLFSGSLLRLEGVGLAKGVYGVFDLAVLSEFHLQGVQAMAFACSSCGLVLYCQIYR